MYAMVLVSQYRNSLNQICSLIWNRKSNDKAAGRVPDGFMYCFTFQGYEKKASSIFLTNPRITASKQCMCGHTCEKLSAGVPPFLTVLLVGGHPPIPLGHDKHAAAHSKNASYFSDLLKQGSIVSEVSNRNRIYKPKV